MIRKFTARRLFKLISILAVVFLTLLIYNLSFHPNVDFLEEPGRRQVRHVNKKREVVEEASNEITIWTYKEPPPCVSCPGENGEPVDLTVTNEL